MNTTHVVAVHSSVNSLLNAGQLLVAELSNAFGIITHNLAELLGNFRKTTGAANHQGATASHKPSGGGGGGGHRGPHDDEEEEKSVPMSLSDAARIMRTSNDADERHRAAQLLGAAGGHARGTHHLHEEEEEIVESSVHRGHAGKHHKSGH